MNQLAHFAIHAGDVRRAAKFYEAVFNWKCAGYEQAGVTDEEFVQIIGSDRKAHGAIQSRKYNPLPSDLTGFECSFEVADVDVTAHAVQAAGGKIVMQKTAIPDVGWIIKFQDSEGNFCCAVRYDRGPDKGSVSMTNAVRHFEIESADVERAKAFYEKVFGWTISPWGPPNYYLITTDVPGAGDIRELHGPAGASRGFVCTVTVADLKPVKDAVVNGGGRIVVPEFRIDGVGNLMYITDTEGNRVGVMKYAGV